MWDDDDDLRRGRCEALREEEDAPLPSLSAQLLFYDMLSLLSPHKVEKTCMIFVKDIFLCVKIQDAEIIKHMLDIRRIFMVPRGEEHQQRGVGSDVWPSIHCPFFLAFTAPPSSVCL